jgi:hypothetical protein
VPALTPCLHTKFSSTNTNVTAAATTRACAAYNLLRVAQKLLDVGMIQLFVCHAAVESKSMLQTATRNQNNTFPSFKTRRITPVHHRHERLEAFLSTVLSTLQQQSARCTPQMATRCTRR